MTVSNETYRSGPYSGNGVTTEFSYGFRIIDESHLSVVLADADGVETTLTLLTDYTVSDVGEDAGGEVMLASAPAAGETVTLVRNVPFKQETDLQNQGGYYPQTVEDALDLAVMRDQLLQEQLDRAIKVTVSDGGEDPTETLTANLMRLAESADHIDTVAVHADNVDTVAGIAADVSTVSGVSRDVSTVAGVSADVTTVAGLTGDVTTVAGHADNVDTVAGIAADVSVTAGISANVTAVAGIAGKINTVAGISADVSTVAGIADQIELAAASGAAGTAFVPAGGIEAKNVQAAIEELDEEKAPLVHSHAVSDVTGLQGALVSKAPSARSIMAGTGLTGGGTLAADLTLSISASSQAQAELGTDNTTVMTPLTTAQAIAALGGNWAETPAVTLYQTARAYKFAHGLGALPKVWQCYARCRIAGAGYEVGNEILVASQSHYFNSWRMSSIWADEVEFGFAFNSTAAVAISGKKGGNAPYLGDQSGMYEVFWRYIA
ncbi:hypothetical protein [Breoghania sp.]|uniref:hypothetical protein n=1 Tax=Breoghania sp. TaxID=2065378 RepID=UPI002AA9128B|nr:hypothetical protein [Breoghania sp.]